MVAGRLRKLTTFDAVGPGETRHGKWNNAWSEIYHLNAWPRVADGGSASVEIADVTSLVHDNPSERELHFYVKNVGETTADIDVWAAYWNWTPETTLEAVIDERGVPAVGGAIVTNRGVNTIGVAGTRKHGSGEMVELHDRWHLGSDTKAMTATLVGVLAQKGAIGWDLTVADAFPEWADSMQPMFHQTTFERLLAHRSGIVDAQDEWTALGDTKVSIEQRRRNFAKTIVHRKHGSDEILFDAPGFVYLYQNANFVLVGAMLERCLGTSWEALMDAEVFGPLGMTTAGYGAPGSASAVDQPWGHSDASGKRVPNKSDNTPGLGPAGTVHASLTDWAKFIQLHLDGSAGDLTLWPSTLSRLHTEYDVSANSIYPVRYGWGWGIWDSGLGIALGHDGSNGSWYCSCQVLPAEGVGFIAVSNIGGTSDTGPDNGQGNLACWDVMAALRDHYFAG